MSVASPRECKTQQGWHMALAGSEMVSITDGVSDVSGLYSSLQQSNRYVLEILPSTFRRGCRFSSRIALTLALAHASTYQELAIQSCACPISKDREIYQSMTSLAVRRFIPQRMLNQHSSPCRKLPTTMSKRTCCEQPITLMFVQAHCSDATFAQIPCA